jgi:RNA-binding protein YlmH
MNNYYIVKKNVDKIRRGGYTYFINSGIYKEICYNLKKNEYSIYYPYEDCDKFILYTREIPRIRLLEIKSYFSLTHSEILGSLFGLNISDEIFGDIILDNDKYYVYIMDEIYEFILNNFKMVGNKNIEIKAVDLSTLENYSRKYETLEFIVSSLRSDTVIARIISSSRDKVKDKLRKKEIIVNYDVLSNGAYVLKENDVFSIRKYGKYKFIGIVKTTKKDNYIIRINKYL